MSRSAIQYLREEIERLKIHLALIQNTLNHQKQRTTTRGSAHHFACEKLKVQIELDAKTELLTVLEKKEKLCPTTTKTN